jgi:hypothetical protein
MAPSFVVQSCVRDGALKLCFLKRDEKGAPRVRHTIRFSEEECRALAASGCR